MSKTKNRWHVFLARFVSSLLLIHALSPLAVEAQSISASQFNYLRNLYPANAGGKGANNPNSIRGKGQPESLREDPRSLGGSSGFGSGIDYQVHVLGEIKNPGTYRFGPSVRIAEAIAAAGGVTNKGSMRTIELRRIDQSNRKVDLFRFIHKGDLSANPFLQDNDVIFVPFVASTVRIEGPVKRAGVYELVSEKNLWDLIELAGGFTTGISKEGEIVVVRYEDGKKKLLKTENQMEALKNFEMQNADIIVIPHIFTKNKKFDYVFPELPSDEVFYPSYNDNVYVIGAVNQSGSYPFNPHFGVREYANMAGPNQLAKIRQARVLTADGKVVRNTRKYSLNPGDTVIVPEKKATVGNMLTWYNTILSTALSYFTVRGLVKELE